MSEPDHPDEDEDDVVVGAEGAVLMDVG